MSDDRLEPSTPEDRERSYGIRLFFAFVTTAVANAIIRQFVDVNFWTFMAIAIAVFTVSWYVIVQRWRRSHPK